MRRARVYLGFILALALAGCGAAGPRPGVQPAAYRPPTTSSPSRAKPGGDASDPERAALERLLTEPFETKPDRKGTMRIYLADVYNWSRTHMFGVKTRQAFHYGDERYGVSAVWLMAAHERDDPPACLEAFLSVYRETALSLGTSFSRERRRNVAADEASAAPAQAVWIVEADVTLPFRSSRWIGSVVATHPFPGICLIQGLALRATHHPDIATRAIDRWIAHGAPALNWYDPKTAPSLDMSY